MAASAGQPQEGRAEGAGRGHAAVRAARRAPEASEALRARALGLAGAAARALPAAATAPFLTPIANVLRVAPAAALPFPCDLTRGGRMLSMSADSVSRFVRVASPHVHAARAHAQAHVHVHVLCSHATRDTRHATRGT
eukprot:2152737-Prymnesium_polylepis.1